MPFYCLINLYMYILKSKSTNMATWWILFQWVSTMTIYITVFLLCKTSIICNSYGRNDELVNCYEISISQIKMDNFPFMYFFLSPVTDLTLPDLNGSTMAGVMRNTNWLPFTSTFVFFLVRSMIFLIIVVVCVGGGGYGGGFFFCFFLINWVLVLCLI